MTLAKGKIHATKTVADTQPKKRGRPPRVSNVQDGPSVRQRTTRVRSTGVTANRTTDKPSHHPLDTSLRKRRTVAEASEDDYWKEIFDIEPASDEDSLSRSQCAYTLRTAGIIFAIGLILGYLI